MSVPPELSIIVPLLNEAEIVPELFRILGDQAGIRFELLLCDGGSVDGTVESSINLAAAANFPCRIVSAPKGRGRQMNAGAKIAAADFLLFLHADSSFAESRALRLGLAALRGRSAPRVAGRFALRFRRPSGAPSLAYHFYECKARLDRPGCIHGDQGFLLSRSFFEEAGPFDETLPLLEDDRLADRVRKSGEWLLLPAEIETSPRRFEVEGLWQRQLLNALLMNFAALDWHPFFRAAPEVYREQGRGRRLRLAPFFRLLRRLLRELPFFERLRLWYVTGSYVRANAWQLLLWLDARRSFRRGLPPGAGGTPCLDRFAPWFDRLTDHPPGRLAAALLTWGWFRATGLILELTEKKGPQLPREKGE